MKHTPTTKRKAPVKWAMAALVAALAATPAVRAQTNVDGAISGQGSGAGTVVVESSATGSSRTAKVGADGVFRFGALPPGSYTVTFTDASGVPVAKTVEVSLGLTSTVVLTSESVALDAFVVESERVNPVDFAKTESGTVFSNKLLTTLPVAQSVSAVALLAPGTTQGDADFGDLISFGGSSVAENAYFINGFNVADFRQGLSPSSVPYEFYDQFEVKTGAYSAEFGRSTGGVVNATTKSGSNRFSGGVVAYYRPASLRGKSDDYYYFDPLTNESNVHSHNTQDRRSQATINVYASGPLWRNKLFFYGIYTKRDIRSRNIVTQGTQMEVMKDKEPFWGAKLDFLPFEGHHLEYTAFADKSNEQTSTYDYDYKTLAVTSADPTSNSFKKRGGTNQVLRYTGTFIPDLTLSALYGWNRAAKTQGSDVDGDPGIYDTRAGYNDWVSGNPDLIVSSGYDKRTAMRVDVEYAFSALGRHRFKVGYDREDNESISVDNYTGGYYWRYYTVTPGSEVAGATVPAGVTEVVRERTYSNGGGFKVLSGAWYAEDNWTLPGDRLLFRLGLRNETFENKNAMGTTFIKSAQQYAPRLGVSYDLFGDKKTKVYANFGRYHLPIAAQTNIRLAGSERYVQQYYVLNGINAADYTPQKGNKLGGVTVFSDGQIRDKRRIVADDIGPMYQDEWVLGLQQKLNKDWTTGVRFTYRDLKQSIDDVIVDDALIAYAKKNGYDAQTVADILDDSGHEYVLANPGKDITYYFDLDDDGKLEKVPLSAKDIGFDNAKRKYYATELFLERVFDGKWQMQASYTWSQVYGNTEGWVNSDTPVAQDDTGITSDFDAIGLMRGAYGFLPNDRRHQIKVFGSYAVTKRLQVGANARWTSGRPINRFGVYPASLDSVANGYDAEAFWIGGDPADGGKPTSRGDGGRTPWTCNLDLSVMYKPEWGKDKVTMGVNVFNVLNLREPEDVRETYEEATGERDYRYGLPGSLQSPIRTELYLKIEY